MTWGTSSWGDKPWGWAPSAGSAGTPATAYPGGLLTSSAIGAPSAKGRASAYPFGVQATGAIGAPTVIAGGSAVALPAGVQTASAVGVPVARGAAKAYPLGLVGYWSVGTPVVPGPSPFTPEQLAYLLSYMQDNLMIPTPTEIAAAVRSDLSAELVQLTKVSKLHGIGVDLVVTPTSRTAGDVSQTISTSGDAVTVSAA